VDRELILCKIKVDPRQRSEIAEIANIFRAHIADVSPESLIVEATGSEGKIKALLSLLAPYNLLEVARGGRVAMARSLTPTPAAAPQTLSPVA